MTHPKTWQKAAALFLFSSAIVVFVAYRAGAFDHQQAPSNYGGMTAVDSPDVKKPVIMHSTKSAPVFHRERSLNYNEGNTPDTPVAKKPKMTIMHSTKSAPMYEPEEETQVTPPVMYEKEPQINKSRFSEDSVKKSKPQRNVFIGGSKSIRMHEPRYIPDSVKEKKAVKPQQEKKQEPAVMPGSKSDRMFDPYK